MKRMVAALLSCVLLSCVLLSCVLLVSTASGQERVPNAAPELGQLFFSRAEREVLERERGRAPPDKPMPDAPQLVKVDGLIMRPGQASLPVVNGRVVFPGDNPSGLRISGRSDGRVLIAPPEGPARLARPGQTVDLVTGDVREMYELPGRRQARRTEVPLPVPYTTGTAPKAEPATAVQVKKAQRPRRAAGKRGATPPPKRAGDTPPPVPQRVAPANAPAPAIPAPMPRLP